MRLEILCAGWCLAGALVARGESARAPDELVLAHRGAPAEYAVVLPAAASDSQRYASEELVKYVEMTTGVKLPVVTEREARPAKGIYLGDEAADLGEEGFRLKTEGPNLRICGSAVRGTLYGVYELLERFAGCRWYASWCTIAPPRETIAVPSDLDEAQRPAFPCREPHWWDMFKPDFATHCRANGASMRLQARHGGATWRFGGGLGNCHTFSQLQDNVRFFRDHHVKTLFEQGACQGRHAGFAELKAWLLAKWMWNPDLPIQPLLDDFFAGYYGAAAPYVRRVFEQAHALQLAAADEGRFLKIYEDPNTSPLTDAFLEEAAAEMAAAERAVKDDPLRSYNVRMTSFGVDYMRAERLRRGTRLVDFVREGATDDARTRLRNLVCSLLARMDEAKDIRLGSGNVKGRHARLLEAWRRVEAGADAPCVVTRDKEGRRTALVEDAHLNILKDNGLKKGRCGVQRKSGEISDGEYAWYDLGEWTPGDTADKQYFWAATGYFNKQEPGAHSAVKAVYLDALRLSEM